MTDKQIAARTKAAWSPAARAKRKATKAAKNARKARDLALKGLREMDTVMKSPDVSLLKVETLTPVLARRDPPLFTAEQVAALLRALL